jgi:hypothetical protein
MRGKNPPFPLNKGAFGGILKVSGIMITGEDLLLPRVTERLPHYFSRNFRLRRGPTAECDIGYQRKWEIRQAFTYLWFHAFMGKTIAVSAISSGKIRLY